MQRRIEFRCTDKEYERYDTAARKSGRNLSSWLRWLANTSSEWPTEVLPTPVAERVRTGFSVPAIGPDGEQDSVQEIVFERPGTWRLLTVGGLRTSTTKRPDPSSKKWAKQDLMTFCVENDVLGFQRAWDQMESENVDGGFSQ